MAKKRHHVGKVHRRKSHKKTHRRRRMGAVRGSGDVIETLVGVCGGSVLGDVVANAITAPAYVLGVSEIIVGAGIAYFGGGLAIVKGAGMGIAAAGLVSALQDAGAIQGIAGLVNPSAATALPKRLNGFRDVPAVGAFPKPAMVGRTERMMKQAYKGVY